MSPALVQALSPSAAQRVNRTASLAEQVILPRSISTTDAPDKSSITRNLNAPASTNSRKRALVTLCRSTANAGTSTSYAENSLSHPNAIASLDTPSVARPAGAVIDSYNETTAVATTAGGTGEAFDFASGMKIENGGETFDISLANVETVEELLNTLNRLLGSDRLS